MLIMIKTLWGMLKNVILSILKWLWNNSESIITAALVASGLLSVFLFFPFLAGDLSKAIYFTVLAPLVLATAYIVTIVLIAIGMVFRGAYNEEKKKVIKREAAKKSNKRGGITEC